MEFTLNSPAIFPVGTTVGVYAASGWIAGTSPAPGTAPKGAQVTSGVVGAAGVTFSGLTERVRYYAAGEVEGSYRYVSFTAVAPKSSGGSEVVVADVTAPAATGVAATDTAALEKALTATPVGGTLLLRGHYKINKPLTRATAIRLITTGMSYSVGLALSTPPSGPTEISQINGTIIEQTAVGQDAIDFTGSAASLVMKDVAIVFTAGLASTGHGINCTPTEMETGEHTGHSPGIYGGSIDNVLVLGHDGNHYGLVLVNHCEFTRRDFRTSGGGGVLEVADGNRYNYGNVVAIHDYIHLYASGTAHGLAHSAAASYPAAGGSLNLCTHMRPQCNIDGAAAVTGTQALWTDKTGVGEPARCLVIAPDFEAPGHANPIVFGEGTEVLGGNTLLGSANQQLENTALGFRALGTASQNNAKQNVAFGWEALRLNTANNITAVGALALAKNTTGTGNTAVGSQALGENATGTNNTALGTSAGKVSTGANTTAIGSNALKAVTASAGNTAVGAQIGESVTGALNTLMGLKAGHTLVAQERTTVIGAEADSNASHAVALGYEAKGNGEGGTAIGYKASVTTKGSVAIGSDSTGTGAKSEEENLFVLGTATHKVQVPGKFGMNGAAPVAKAAAIVSPAAELAALKTAVDFIREAIKAVGVTS